MKILANWLNDYLSTKVDAKTAADRLERAGIEIEQIIGSKKLDKKIIVADVKKVIQHPNAERLKLVEVDAGKGLVRVVCGAPNVREGLKVALAQVGAVLPDGNEIKLAVIRGEESNGMLCSARELALGEDHTGIMELEAGLRAGTTLCDIVDNDEILDLTTGANRSDLVSVVGLAREAAAQGGEVVQQPEVGSRSMRVDEGLVGDVEKTTVKRYVLARVKLDRIGESPQWMQQRLRASGLRPINAVVDITNYVMLETGQPLHAFDAAKVALPVGVRSPSKGEKLTTLDGVNHPLSPNDLVIADSRGPLALAGVMGGLASEIRTDTNEILLEAACFDGATIRRMAASHGLRTDASARFERNLPLPLSDLGLGRALDLLVEHCQAQLISVSSSELASTPPRPLNVSLARIMAILGMPVNRDEAETALTNLGFGVSGTGDKLELSLPWWRPDVSIEEDIAEEVGRTIGYDNLPATLPAWAPPAVEFDRFWAHLWQLKAILRGLGMSEVVTYSFVSRKQLDDFDHDHTAHLKLKNPLSIEQAYLRSTLAPSLVASVARNAHIASEFGFYEVSKVFIAGSDHTRQPQEPLRLGVIWRGNNAYRSVKTVLDALAREFATFRVLPKTNPIFSSSRSAQVQLEKQPIGWIGEINPEILKRHKISNAVGYLEIDLLPWLTDPATKTYQEISRFPSITRDLSIVVSTQVLWAEIEAFVQSSKVAEVSYLSEYFGPDLPAGSKSLALRLTFSSPERTMTDKEADAGASKVMQLLEKQFKARQRT